MDSSRLPLKDDQNVNEEIQALVKKHLDETRLVQGTRDSVAENSGSKYLGQQRNLCSDGVNYSNLV